MNHNKILIIGLGRVGLPIAKHAKKKGFDVYGYDACHKVMYYAEKEFGIKKSSDFREFGIYMLCVPTVGSRLNGLLRVIRKISQEAPSGALIAIEGTIHPGTSEKVFAMVNHRLHVAYIHPSSCPSETGEHQLACHPRLASGVRECCLMQAIQFYSGATTSLSTSLTNSTRGRSVTQNIYNDSYDDSDEITGRILLKMNCDTTSTTDADGTPNSSLGIPLQTVANAGLAELASTIKKSYKYLQMAFAEDLYLYSSANNIHFSELRTALNSKWNVKIPDPTTTLGARNGREEKRLHEASAAMLGSKILKAATKVDEIYRKSKENQI
jgi:UDP-N-acetyl-D-mannosaminuronic acid dehydrogenase